MMKRRTPLFLLIVQAALVCAGLPAQEAAGSAQPFPQMMKVDGGTFSMKDYDGSMRSVTVSDFEISATAEYFSCT